MSGEWSDWFKHDGGPCPCRGATVNTRHRGGHECVGIAGSLEMPGRASSWEWGTWFPCSDIVRYRLRRPPAVRLLVELVEGLPVREREDA